MAEYLFDDPATQNFIRKGIERLRDEFRGIFSHETIQRFVDEAIASLADARRQGLRAAVRASLCAGATASPRPGPGCHCQGRP